MTAPSQLGRGKSRKHAELLRWVSENIPTITNFIRPIMAREFPSLFKESCDPKFDCKLVQAYQLKSDYGPLDSRTDTIIDIHTSLQEGDSVSEDDLLLIVDAKPDLKNILPYFYQMNANASLFDFDKNYNHITKRMKIIVTYDVDSEYDSMLAQQGVYIYHVGSDKSGCYRCGAFKTHALPVGNSNTSSFISHTHDYREIKVCGLCEGYINRLNPKEGTDHVCTNCDEIIYSAGNFVDDNTGVRLCNICRNILEAGIRPLGMSCNVCRMEANRSYDGQFKMVQEDDDKLFETLSSRGVLCSVCGGKQVTRYLINESGHTYIYCNDCYRGSEKCSICGKRRKYDRFDNYDDNLRCIDGCDDIYYEDGS